MSLDDRSPQATTVRRRSTRDRPAKAPLSVEAIVVAALEILKSEGLDAVTMRRVAAALDTGAASLYVYVANREGLQLAMLDRVTAQVTLETPDPVRWRDQLHGLLSRMHATLVAYPGLAAMTLAFPPMTDAVLTVTENLLGILLVGGIDVQDAAWACDLFVLLVTGVASEDDVRRVRGDSKADHRAQIDQLQKTFAGMAPDRFPLLVAHAEQMVAGDSDERFRFAVDVVLDGVLARAARH
ncbi:MAG: TetR/AcrR family transcriptional regulator [Acidimicrobiales bacterium]